MNKTFWRAQLGGCFRTHFGDDGLRTSDVPIPHPPSRMVPLADRAVEGRANAKGIPCLYMAEKRQTALAEVRPWVGATISVAQMRILRDLKLVDFTVASPGMYVYFEEPGAKEKERAVWADINRAFSEPVTLGDDVADYAPTQTIAELFKTNGLDGIMYRSSLGSGRNVALFDLDAAKLVGCWLFRPKTIRFKFEPTGEPYFISESSLKTCRE